MSQTFGEELMGDSADEDVQRAIIATRKEEHLTLCASGDVAFRARSALFEGVEFIHNALPDVHVDAVDLSIELFGKRLSAPLVIAAMTGGTSTAEQINKDLARAAQELSLGFGLGSQRAMILRPDSVGSFRVRDVAPDALVLGNIGVVQARSMHASAINQLVRDVGADALCVHLNPAMELIQSNGDRDFGRTIETMRRLVHEVRVPIIAKETGCGLSRSAAHRLACVGVQNYDVSGAGGTSWVAVETTRAASPRLKRLGELLWDWGIPTAASVAMVSSLDPKARIIATGGVRSGMDVAKSIALGATAAGIAAPILKAHRTAGYEGVLDYLLGTIEELRAVTFLTGCVRIAQLQSVARIVSPQLQAWIDAEPRPPRLPAVADN